MSPGAETYRFPFRRGADVYDALFLKPYPQREGRVQQRVDGDRAGRVVLCALEAELVVPEEAGRCHEEGGVPQAEPHVGQGVRLLQAQAVEVVGERIVRGVLQVCEVVERDLLGGDGHLVLRRLRLMLILLLPRAVFPSVSTVRDKKCLGVGSIQVDRWCWTRSLGVVVIFKGVLLGGARTGVCLSGWGSKLW